MFYEYTVYIEANKLKFGRKIRIEKAISNIFQQSFNFLTLNHTQTGLKKNHIKNIFECFENIF